MDKLAPILLAVPVPAEGSVDNAAYDTAVKTHVQKLSKLLKDQPGDVIAYGSKFLDLLDPSVHSLSYLAILHTILIPGLATSVSRDALLEKLVIFLLTFDPVQCRYVGSHLQDIFLLAGNGELLPPSAAVEALATAILRLDPTGSMLTTAHIYLARLAYNTNNVEPALQVIDKSIVFFPGMANPTEPRYLCDVSLPPPAYISRESGLTGILKAPLVMEYDLLCGMMHCSRREWAKAYVAFERLVTFPTREGGVSKIMIEAYKKWVLVSLLSKGKLVETPSHAGVSANKFYGSLAKAYTTIAVLFVADDAKELKSEVEKNAAVWLEDGNTGLVQEVLAAYQKWRVLGLERIYSKISLSEIRQQTTSAETGEPLTKDEDVETLLQNMIISGMLSGVIEKNDDGTTFLTFLSPSTHLSEPDVARELATAATRLKQLQPLFKATRDRLGTSKEYIKHVVKEEKRTVEKGEADPSHAFDTHVDDEDLMGGVIATG
ncbi:hypothetical protein F4818DRAFT_405683 [Hypoxylon cercidicola]|nr:hypothetical protein F4818DRAFT_405683 [Hypoxylon cercidicola]